MVGREEGWWQGLMCVPGISPQPSLDTTSFVDGTTGNAKSFRRVLSVCVSRVLVEVVPTHRFVPMLFLSIFLSGK
jgi:hypothetical protein